MKDPMTNFEIPPEMRAFAEKSVEQAKKAFDGYIVAAQRAVGMFDHKSTEAQTGAREIGEKAMRFAERNINSSFEFAQKLVRATDVEELMRLQTDYVKAQMQVLTDQAKELGEATARMSQSTIKPKN
ncbi:MAG: phasin [Rhizobiales bacterium]|nr:phasin [Hyphomicrobiales bacterium]